MALQLVYGEGTSVQLDLPEGSPIHDFSAPRGTPLDDPAAAVAAALVEPLEFPPLSQATIPGDRIAIALDHGVPAAAAVVAGVVQTLLEGGTQPSDIAIVLPPIDERSVDPTAMLREEVRSAVEVSIHNPHDRESLSYLAASKDGKPIYFNRTIFDADVVVPISTLRVEDSLGYVGVHGGLFPTFSDAETKERFCAPSSADWGAHRRRRREEADEAVWQLGVQFTIQIAPGPNDTVLHVLAGDSNAVAREGQRLCEVAWRHQPKDRASLVVAAIDGGPEQQTWDNFARALFTASQGVVDGGSIVLCTQLKCRPGPALQRLRGSRDDHETAHELRRQRSPDAVSATLLMEALSRARVYLLSDLDGDFVEELGVGHVAEIGEVEHLSRQHDSCIVVGSAQHAVLNTSDS